MTQNSKREIRIPRWAWLLVGVFLLYFVPALMLEISYGPSYNIFTFHNHWAPDGNGGWKAVGFPEQRRPSVPSENISIFLRLMPFVLPALLALLYFLGPLSKFVEKEADYSATKYSPEEYRPEFIDQMPELEDEQEALK